MNPVDVKLRSGIVKDLLPLSLPHVLGGDFSGAITAVGAGVSESRIGKRVIGSLSVIFSSDFKSDSTEIVVRIS